VIKYITIGRDDFHIAFNSSHLHSHLTIRHYKRLKLKRCR